MQQTETEYHHLFMGGYQEMFCVADGFFGLPVDIWRRGNNDTSLSFFYHPPPFFVVPSTSLSLSLSLSRSLQILKTYLFASSINEMNDSSILWLTLLLVLRL